MDATRVDRYLWAIRLCKTRSEATNACGAGHVRVNSRSAKPAQRVVVGDRIEARIHGRDRIVEVVQVIDKRVGAALAVDCYTDHSPAVPARDRIVPIAERDPGAGRPTKRDRRQMDRYRER